MGPRLALFRSGVQFARGTGSEWDGITIGNRDRPEHGEWLSNDFKIKDEDPSKLMFGDKEVTLFRVKESAKIPWEIVGVEYIMKAHVDKSSVDYYKNRTRNYVHYIDTSGNIFKHHLSPLAKILHDRFKEAKDVARRAPILQIVPQNENAAKAIGEVLPQWNGDNNAMIFRVPAVDAPPVDLAIVLVDYKNYRLSSSNTKPRSRFCMLLTWCVDMIRQISHVNYCELNYGVPDQR